MAIYLLSILLKTTKITASILGLGAFGTYIWFGIWHLYLIYQFLKIMFEDSFWIGLILFFLGLPLAHYILIFVGVLLVLLFGGPLYLIHQDLEKRFYSNNSVKESPIKEAKAVTLQKEKNTENGSNQLIIGSIIISLALIYVGYLLK